MVYIILLTQLRKLGGGEDDNHCGHYDGMYVYLCWFVHLNANIISIYLFDSKHVAFQYVFWVRERIFVD